MIPESLLLSGFGSTVIGFQDQLLNMSFKNGPKDIILIRVWICRIIISGDLCFLFDFCLRQVTQLFNYGIHIHHTVIYS